MLVFFVFMIVYSVKLVIAAGAQVSAAMRIPMRVVYCGMPLGFTLMLIFGIERLVNDIKGKSEDALDKYDVDVEKNREEEGPLL